MTPSSNNSSNPSASQKKVVDLKVYIPSVEVNGRTYVSYNGKIYGPAQQNIGYQSGTHQDDEQLYQDDFAGFHGLTDNDDDILQEQNQYNQASAATLPDDINDTKILDKSKQHTSQPTVWSMPFPEATTSKKRSVDPHPMQKSSQQSYNTTMNSPSTEQKKSTMPSRNKPSKASAAGHKASDEQDGACVKKEQ